ncbi:MAG: transporter substrate-binding domain-containing protein [Spirochaetales bacterium]|nr:transporter substrate-binding domain-containing protein [Spirochaetales bacterium]
MKFLYFFHKKNRTQFSLRSLILVVFIFLSLPSLYSADILKVGMHQYPPYYYYKDGKFQGSIVETILRVAKQAKLEVEFYMYPTARLYFSLGNGYVDMWPGIRGVESLKGKVYGSDYLVRYIEIQVYYLEGTTPPTSLDELVGVPLIVIEGYTYGGAIDSIKVKNSQLTLDVPYYSAPTHLNALKMLLAGRAKYLINFREPMEDVLSSEKKVRIQSFTIAKLPATWIWTLANPKTKELQRRFDEAYRKLYM